MKKGLTQRYKCKFCTNKQTEIYWADDRHLRLRCPNCLRELGFIPTTRQNVAIANKGGVKEGFIRAKQLEFTL